MRVTSTLLAVSLLGFPAATRAEDTTKADPFRPVQPAWPDGWSGSGPAPAPVEEAKPLDPSDDNEVFTFDNEPPPTPPVSEKAAEEKQPTPVPTVSAATQPPPAPPPSKPAEAVDLRTPHVWMVAGGVTLGASALAALVVSIALDEPGLAGAALGVGGALGIAGLTVGVVMQNQRLEAAGHQVQPALPTGIALKVALTR